MMTKNKKENVPFGHEFEIKYKGSLGVLTYGDIGLRAWRALKQKTLKSSHK
jgi:hypothetical protein